MIFCLAKVRSDIAQKAGVRCGQKCGYSVLQPIGEIGVGDRIDVLLSRELM